MDLKQSMTHASKIMSPLKDQILLLRLIGSSEEATNAPDLLQSTNRSIHLFDKATLVAIWPGPAQLQVLHL